MLKNILHPVNSFKLIKHNNILQELITAYNNKKLHHAYILCGIKGIGKATLAYIFSKLVLSNNSKDNIDLSSINNQIDINLINHNSHPNLLVIEPEFDEKASQYKNIITIDQVRNIKEFLNSTSLNASSCPKIVIIDAIDNLNLNAANSILKVLEEPSSNRVFILICHNLSSILPTIISRCVIKKFSPLNKEQIYEIVQLLKLNVDKIKHIESLEVASMQDIMWFLDPNNYKVYELAVEIIKNKDISKINLLSDSIKGFNSFNFQYLIEIITPKNINYPGKFLDSKFYNIKSILEKDRAFNLDKSTILTSYIMDLIN